MRLSRVRTILTVTETVPDIKPTVMIGEARLRKVGSGDRGREGIIRFDRRKLGRHGWKSTLFVTNPNKIYALII